MNFKELSLKSVATLIAYSNLAGIYSIKKQDTKTIITAVEYIVEVLWVNHKEFLEKCFESGDMSIGPDIDEVLRDCISILNL